MLTSSPISLMYEFVGEILGVTTGEGSGDVVIV